LKQQCDEPHSNFAFNNNLRHYTKQTSYVMHVTLCRIVAMPDASATAAADAAAEAAEAATELAEEDAEEAEAAADAAEEAAEEAAASAAAAGAYPRPLLSSI
jgi:hypothetical protein